MGAQRERRWRQGNRPEPALVHPADASGDVGDRARRHRRTAGPACREGDARGQGGYHLDPSGPRSRGCRAAFRQGAGQKLGWRAASGGWSTDGAGRGVVIGADGAEAADAGHSRYLSGHRSGCVPAHRSGQPHGGGFPRHRGSGDTRRARLLRPRCAGGRHPRSRLHRRTRARAGTRARQLRGPKGPADLRRSVAASPAAGVLRDRRGQA